MTVALKYPKGVSVFILVLKTSRFLPPYFEYRYRPEMPDIGNWQINMLLKIPGDLNTYRILPIKGALPNKGAPIVWMMPIL